MSSKDTTALSPVHKKILFALFVGIFMGAIDIAIVGPALTSIKKEFMATDRAIAWVSSAYMLAFMIGTPLMASLSDMYGRRRIYIIDVLLFALGSLILIIAPGYRMLLLGRAIQGLGGGGLFVAGAVIGDVFPPSKRGGALGMVGMVFSLAFILGPLIGALLLPFGWRWLFIINFPMSLIVIYLGYTYLPGRSADGDSEFDYLGLGILATMIVLLSRAANDINVTKLLDSVTSGDFLFNTVAFALLVPLFIAVERMAQRPVFDVDVIAVRQVAIACVIGFGGGIAQSSFVFIPSLAQYSLGLKESAAGMMMLPMVMVSAFSSPLVGRLLDRIGSRTVISGGTVLISLGLFIVSRFPDSFVLFAVGLMTIGSGLTTLSGAPLRYIMLNESRANSRGSAISMITLVGSVGQALGGVLFGAVAASYGGGTDGYRTGFLLASAVVIMLLVMARGLKNRTEELKSHHAVSEAALNEAVG